MSKSASSTLAGIPRNERPYDVIVYGATGFTGAIVAEYLSGASGRKAFVGEEGHKLRWALAGRSAAKLEKVKAGLQINSALVHPPAIEIADSEDVQALQRMTAQTRVVIATVGPFARYGEPLVAAAVKTGTDYVDITGESQWVAGMIARYSEQAAKSHALIVNMCGYDSIPSDLAAFLAADYLRSKHGVAVGHMQGYASVKGAGASGGTIASILYMRESETEGSKQYNIMHPYLLNPASFEAGAKRVPTWPAEKEQLLPRYHADTGAWSIPFVMALVNTRVVRRSLALRRQLERSTDGFGAHASYNECMRVGGMLQAFVMWLGLALFGIMLATAPTRAVLKRLLPASGEGPSAEKRAQSFFTHRVVARGAAGAGAEDVVVAATIKGGDPGYTDTAKMISQMALMLAHQRKELPLQQLVSGGESGSSASAAGAGAAAQGPVGGFYTPSVVGGHLLEQRLKHAGLQIEVGDFQPKNENKSGSKAAKRE